MEKQQLQVAVRIRPQLTPDNIWVRAVSDRCLQTINHRNIDESLEYEFEQVFGPETSQERVYTNCVRPLLSRVLEGQNASVFAYGPTGSGKTHTILGEPSQPGVIPRCVADLFTDIQQQQTVCGDAWSFSVNYSYLEIYNEKIQDLLEPRPLDFPIREDRHHNLFVCGLSEKLITSVDDFNSSFVPASRNRTTAATRLNAHSSRSHSLLLIKVTKSQLPGSSDGGSTSRRQLTGKLYIIDLAGSEDNRRTGNQGLRLKESGAINTSLFMLSEVVDALHKQKSLIPYRQSKLTRLLQDSLGGTAYSCMIVNIAPEERHYLDTLSTLKLARKSKKIVNTVTVHEETIETVSRDIYSHDRRVKRTSSGREQLTELCENPPSSSFISPLLRRQKQFEENVGSRIALLESRLLRNLQNNSNALHLEPDSTTRTDVDRSNDSLTEQLSVLRGHLDEMKSTMSMSVRSLSSPDALPVHHSTIADVADELDSLLDSPFVLPEKHEQVKRRRSSTADVRPKRRTRLAATNDDTQDSADVTRPVSAADESVNSDSRCFKMPYNPDFINAHNNEVLQMLNTGTLKQIQTLPTIGVKKAQTIFNYRQLNGQFDTFNDLCHVPGFTAAAVKKFCAANFVHV